VKPVDTNPPIHRLRLLAILLGVLLLIWLPFEDLSENWAVLFAIAIACLAYSYLLIRVHHKNRIIYPLAGFLAGLAVTPMAIALMAFKSGVHSHGFPDFTPGHVLNVIRMTPVWGIAGLLIGGGIALLSFRQPSSSGPEDGQNG